MRETNPRLAPSVIVTLASLLLLVSALHPAQAQTYTVIYKFTGGQDGANPLGSVSIDTHGVLYGTTPQAGGSGCSGFGCGTVFSLKQIRGTWTFNLLYSFAQGSNGAQPYAKVIVGSNGSLYGTTSGGGGGSGCSGFGCGTVFNLRPPATFCRTVLCPWTATVLYRFSNGGADGEHVIGEVVFDPTGNLYGTTTGGGNGYGTVFQLSPSNGGWTKNILYTFNGQQDGAYPYGSLTLDHAGNLYGTTAEGGSGNGVIYEVTPSGGGWTESVVHSFNGSTDGYTPFAGVAFDRSANLYGAASSGSSGNGGTVLELAFSGGSWTETGMYAFAGFNGGTNQDGPFGTLLVDASGNLYGTTRADGAHGLGSVFKLTPSAGGFTYTSLHDFAGGSDGANPYLGSLVFDANGNLYGTTLNGGVTNSSCPTGCGVVFQITP